jgi:hypothetical protein
MQQTLMFVRCMLMQTIMLSTDLCSYVAQNTKMRRNNDKWPANAPLPAMLSCKCCKRQGQQAHASWSALAHTQKFGNVDFEASTHQNSYNSTNECDSGQQALLTCCWRREFRLWREDVNSQGSKLSGLFTVRPTRSSLSEHSLRLVAAIDCI